VNELYRRMKDCGMDVRWYEKTKRLEKKTPKGEVLLNDDHCSLLSIYFLDKAGKLWTTQSDGKPYMIARQTASTLKQDSYICVACKKRFKNYVIAGKHYEANSDT
jgi:hypothetical protein